MTSVVFERSEKSFAHRAAFAASCRKSISSGRFCRISSPSQVNSKEGKIRLTRPRRKVVVFMSTAAKLRKEREVSIVPTVESVEMLLREATQRHSTKESTRERNFDETRRKEDVRFEIRMHALHRKDPSRLPVHRLMYLCQTRNSDRNRVEGGEECRHGLTGFGEEELLQFVEGCREALILERLHGEGPRGGNELNG